MTIDAPCPNCGTIYTVRRELIGKRTKCTRCGTPFVIAEVPLAQAPPASPPPPPDQGLFADLPIHPSYAPHEMPPAPGPAAPRRSSTGEFPGFEQSQSRPRFPVMETVAKLYHIMGFIVLAIGACGFIAYLIAVIREPNMIGLITIAYGSDLIVTMLTALMLFFASQAIRLNLQIERNTHETSDACRRLADHLCEIQVDK